MGNPTIKSSVIIDVREPAEFNDFHIPGAINLPASQFDPSTYEPYRKAVVNLVCRSGRRAELIKSQLENEGMTNVHVMQSQMQDLESSQNDSSGGWSVDRQFRMTLGILLAIFLVAYFNDLKGFIVIPVILATGLIFTSIIDRCYMRIGISKLPWNKNRK